MTIIIKMGGEYETVSKSSPVVGRTYTLEDAATGTTAQNKAFHALIGEYWKSGCHSYKADNFDDFRNQIKRALGAGFEAFVYAVIVDGKPVILDAPTYQDIPPEVRRDPALKQLVRGRLKSWADYTKKERRETMDKLDQRNDAGRGTRPRSFTRYLKVLKNHQGLPRTNAKR